MGKVAWRKVVAYFFPSGFSSPLGCMRAWEGDDGLDRKTLVDGDEMAKLKDVFGGKKTLAFDLEPKIVVLRVSMHCRGCARKVWKHISKMQGVTSFEVNLESKRVVVIGDVSPFEVLASVSKVKSAQLWIAP
ncbi:unnamed protein product [Spirodela intermedia]|uniref:HMA domain-containing protein n=1 Tax=Spirodela intermedia TaxID=51605 RepID=A0A7I8J897_SPIIN|nr:unnamed protein product [Spirodela intermedia]CAA6666280.1 unnamed protein product [Spirodela intermedia]